MNDESKEIALEEIETARDRLSDALRNLDKATVFLKQVDEPLYQMCRLIKGTVWHTREQINDIICEEKGND